MTLFQLFNISREQGVFSLNLLVMD